MFVHSNARYLFKRSVAVTFCLFILSTILFSSDIHVGYGQSYLNWNEFNAAKKLVHESGFLRHFKFYSSFSLTSFLAIEPAATRMVVSLADALPPPL